MKTSRVPSGTQHKVEERGQWTQSFPPRVVLTTYNHVIAPIPHTPTLPVRTGKPEDGAFRHETPLTWALRAYGFKKVFPGISQELYLSAPSE